MKLKSLSVAIHIVAVIWGGIALTAVLGLWRTTTDKTPITYSEGQFAGQYAPSDIRGSYTFDDISKTFGIPVEDLAAAFGIEDKKLYPSFKCKDLEAFYADAAAVGKEIGTASVRYFVALYKGLPMERTNDIYLPATAVEILSARTSLSQQEWDYLNTHTYVRP